MYLISRLQPAGIYIFSAPLWDPLKSRLFLVSRTTYTVLLDASYGSFVPLVPEGTVGDGLVACGGGVGVL